MHYPSHSPANGILVAFISSLLWSSQTSRAIENQPNISQIKFSETPLSEVIEFFRAKSIELHQPGQRINFVVDPKIDQEQTISLRLLDVPFGVAITYMIDYAYLDYRVDTHACFILPRGQGELTKRIPMAPAKTANFNPAKKARQVILKRIEFTEAPIQSVIQYIAERSAEELPGNSGDQSGAGPIPRSRDASVHSTDQCSDFRSVVLNCRGYRSRDPD